MKDRSYHEQAEKARIFAIKAHGNQKYGKKPYIYHLDQVAGKLAQLEQSGWYVPELSYTVGYLHDLLEDTDVTYKEIVDEFCEEVALYVYILSKKHFDGSIKEDYLDTVKSKHIPRIVKIADTLCNLEASVESCQTKRVWKYSNQLACLMK